jgi:hypothetical protein
MNLKLCGMQTHFIQKILEQQDVLSPLLDKSDLVYAKRNIQEYQEELTRE